MTELDFDALMRADIAFQNAYYGLGGTKSNGVRAAIAAYLAAANLPPEGPTVQVVRKIDEPHWVRVEHRGAVLVEGFLAHPGDAVSTASLLEAIDHLPTRRTRGWLRGWNAIDRADVVMLIKRVLS